jgi:hypothetical protein
MPSAKNWSIHEVSLEEVTVDIRSNLKKNLIILTLVAVCSLGLASVAKADNLVIGDSRYLGSIDPGVPSSPTDEIGYINHLIDMALNSSETFSAHDYVRTNASCGLCTDAVLAGSVTDEAAPFNPINLGSGYLYLLAKYGNTDLVWYVGGLTGGGHTIPETIGQGGGLSHWALFNPGTTQVPEPTSLMLLGSAITALGLARKLFRK